LFRSSEKKRDRLIYKKQSVSLFFSGFQTENILPYFAGTLMRVFTSVTEACRANALPFSVTTSTLPAVEVDMP